MNIARAFCDKRLFAAALGDLDTWQVWLTVLCAAFALPLSAEQLQIFTNISGGRSPPTKAVRELWCVCGRRSGKSRTAALLAVFIALFLKHHRAPGERPMVLVIAGSVDQAATVFSYVRGFIEASPTLAREAVAIRRHEIELRNGVIIAVHANSFRTVRGRSLVCAIFDETAFWKDETSATPDIEMYRAVLPSLATTDGKLVGISTPYRKLGLLYQKHRDHFGHDDDDTLVVQGTSKIFNPSLSGAVIAAQREADPTGATAEWDAEFRNDIAAFLDDASIDAAVDHSRPVELPPREGTLYHSFTDMSGGGADASTLTIGHLEGERFIADAVRGRHGDPHAAALDFSYLTKQYHCRTIWGDNYSKEWCAGFYRAQNLEYRQSQLVRSALYLEGQVYFSRGLVSIPADPILMRELRLLERRVARSGKDSVNHGVGGHDDYANALFGCLYVALKAAAQAKAEPPIVMPYIHSVPRRFPGSSEYSDAPVAAGSPHRPSREQPWWPYVRGEW
jgi:Terminase large subunit, ATPase domain